MDLPSAEVPEPDPTLEPAGFMVVTDDGDRIHFLDWDGGSAGTADQRSAAPVLAIHGLSATSWVWAPIARRIGGPAGPARFVAMDLRGHGLSDAPTEDGAYRMEALAGDAIAVAEGAGLLALGRPVLAGHGFGAMVAAEAAARLGDRCAGLVLVDGGWESMEASTGLDVAEFLRGLDEPPEVLRSMAAFLADRRAWGPGTWDADQERAARAAVVETHAGRVVPATRPHAVEATVAAMFSYDPIVVLPSVSAPVSALIAGLDDDAGGRLAALAAVDAARVAAGRSPVHRAPFRHDGHNLMRYRPREVAAAILAAPR
jgi:pimeloyl-ACP methyl ester carboxylesterase